MCVLNDTQMVYRKYKGDKDVKTDFNFRRK